MRKLLIHVRRSMKLFVILGVATVIIIAALTFLYKSTYSVTLDGEFIRIYQ